MASHWSCLIETVSVGITACDLLEEEEVMSELVLSGALILIRVWVHLHIFLPLLQTGQVLWLPSCLPEQWSPSEEICT